MRNICLILLIFLSGSVQAQFNDTFPPQQWITDLDSFFTPEQNEATTKLIKDLYTEDSTGVFLILMDTIPTNIARFTKKYFRQWKLNQAGQKRTVMFVYVYGENGLRIEASDGVRHILGKQYLKDILTYSVIPRMRRGQKYEAIYKGIELIKEKLINN